MDVATDPALPDPSSPFAVEAHRVEHFAQQQRVLVRADAPSEGG